MSKRKSSNKKEEAPSAPPPDPPRDWTRCHCYNHHKKRFCRQEIHSESTKYCGNHLHLQGNKRARIPCPVDPTHYIFEDCLDKHVKKCPKTVQEQRQSEAHFYRRDCNCGGHGALISQEDDTASAVDLEGAKRLALRVLHVHQEVFCQHHQQQEAVDERARRNDNNVQELDEAAIHAALPLVDLSGPEIDAGLVTVAADYRFRTGGPRHLQQQASLIGHLRRIGALNGLEGSGDDKTTKPKTPRKRSILEMGAGRGMTGLVVAGVSAKTTPTRLTMIERGTSRSRAEKFLRKIKAFPDHFSTQTKYLNISSLDFDRIKCDLAHVDMCSVCRDGAKTAPKADTSVLDDKCGDEEEYVVIAKHLCGVGTDLALKSLEPMKQKLSACIMSTCCHGVCFWKDYVGRDYLVEAMVCETSLPSFGNKEFDLLRLWSSGTVRDFERVAKANVDDGSDMNSEDNDETNEDEEDDHSKPATCDAYNISDDDRVRNVARIAEALRLKCGPQGLGRACQRLIDYGRREYLRNVLFSDAKDNAQLLYYVSSEVTPQNAVLIAHKYD